jgi:hypothetical protein
MPAMPNLSCASAGSITSVSKTQITAGLPTPTSVKIIGTGFAGLYNQNRVRLLFVKEPIPTTSVNVSVSEPEDSSSATELTVPIKALLAVLEEINGAVGDNRKFKIVVEVLAQNGSISDTIVGGPLTYIEFV